jgi:hypothetical protein
VPVWPRTRRPACARNPDRIGVVSWFNAPADQPILQPQKDL